MEVFDTVLDTYNSRNLCDNIKIQLNLPILYDRTQE